MQILYAIRSFIFAEGIQSLFRVEGYQVDSPSFCFVSSDKILQKLSEALFQILIVDVDYLDGPADLFFKKIKEIHPALKVIAIAENLDRKILKAYRKGIAASFSKNESKDNVILAIRTILSNQVYVPNSIIMGMISEGHVFTDMESQLKLLSAKEILVVEQLSAGKRMKEVSQEMKIAPSTLSTHKLRIMKKLSLENRRALLNFITAYLDWKRNGPSKL